MNTLREILKFVGIPGPARLYYDYAQDSLLVLQPTMRQIGALVPVLSSLQKTSMRAMIAGLQNLPPISLEAEAVDTVGEAPFEPDVHVEPSGGVILETSASVFRNGTLVSRNSRNLGASGGSAAFLTLGEPGSYQFEVKRIGIPNTGILVLTKSFDVTVKAKPPLPPPTVRPTINSVTQTTGKFEVKGSGFLKSHAVHIRVVNDGTLASDFFQATSDSTGSLDAMLSIPPQASGTTLDFSANDERSDSSDLTGTLWSNTFKISG